MLNVTHTLEHMGFNAGCYTEAVQQVRERLERNTIQGAVDLIRDLLGIEATFIDQDEALMVAQALVEGAIRHEGDVGFDPEEALLLAKKRVDALRKRPENKWMFVKVAANVNAVIETKEIDGVEQQVAVNAKGGFKKGEKERLADEMYKKFLASDPEALDPKKANIKFIAILMKELGMSKAGATTYNYNMKKKYNPDMIVAKVRRA